MKNRIIHIGLIFVMVGSLSISFTACDDNIDPLVTELDLERELSPIGLEAFVRNLIDIELNWTVNPDIEHYVVEFSEDSLEFSSIIRTVTVLPNEVPITESFFGDTRYSARVKAVSATGTDDSKWSAITIRTAPENIFLPLDPTKIEETQTTLNWAPGEEASRFVISPGDIEQTISAGEVTAGEAIVTGLAGYTDYIISIYNGNSKRGEIMFKTLVDPTAPNTTLVGPGDNLSTVIAGAAAGSTLVLEPGDYLTYSGEITLDKAINIRGHYPYDKPLVHISFVYAAGAGDVVISDLDMSGDGASVNTVFTIGTSDLTLGALLIDGCYIHDFGRQLIYGNGENSILTSFTVHNSIVSTFPNGGGDFIDFRKGAVLAISLTNSTFVNTPTGRDFIRFDATTLSGTDLTTNILIDHCTLYGVANSEDRILYVRFLENVLTVRNTIIAGTDAFYTREANASQPICSNNNYFEAEGFYTAGYHSSADFKMDMSSSYTTLDPGFANALDGDFTVSNQALKDRKVGDPRWLE